MNPVRNGIWQVLSGDSTLVALCTGGIHWGSAPQGTTPPLCIFHKVSGTRMWSFSGNPIRNELYLVKGVGFADDAEDIDARCQVLLDRTPINVGGRTLLLAPMPDDDIAYGEDVEGEHYEHVGTNYYLMTEGAP